MILDLTTLDKWADILGFEGLYQISDKGKVRKVLPDDENNIPKYKMIKLVSLGAHYEYRGVCLTKDHVSKLYYIHRLVAEAFIPNELNLPQVNHKDGNKTNNNVNNNLNNNDNSNENSVDDSSQDVLKASADEYATLDMCVLDLFEGNASFVKNAACNTYIKNKNFMSSNQIETRSNKHLRIKHSNKKQLNTELSELPSLNSVH